MYVCVYMNGVAKFGAKEICSSCNLSLENLARSAKFFGNSLATPAKFVFGKLLAQLMLKNFVCSAKFFKKESSTLCKICRSRILPIVPNSGHKNLARHAKHMKKSLPVIPNLPKKNLCGRAKF